MRNLRKNGKIRVIAALAVFAVAALLMGAVVSPSDDFYVVDYAGVLSSETKAFILSQSPSLAQETRAQVVVLTVNSLDGMAASEYALRVIRAWGIGDASLNNGVLLLLAPADGEVYVAVGQGLEGALNDAKIGRFIDDYAIVHYTEGDYDTGTRDLYGMLLSAVMREYGLEGLEGYEDEGAASLSTNDIFLIAVLFIAIMLRILSANRRGVRGGGGWGGFGGFGGGFGGGGRSGGGGFGGFGGSSGGGGAGRRF